jgi:hypothetical protein
LTSEARALLEQQWALESSQHLQNNILPSYEAPINTSIEAGPEFSDINTLDDATYYSNRAYAAPDATPEPEEIFEDVPHQPGKLSTVSNLRLVSFEEMTGRKAGIPIDAPNLSQSHQQNPSLSSPFQSELDYALAMFFHQRQLTKGDVTAFFQDMRLSPISNQLSFHNADEWYAKLNSIPYGLSIDNWKTATVTVPSSITGTGPQPYAVQYQNVENVVRFLLGHTPFKDNLIYSPIRLWNDNNSRVYTEMWTGDWWWEMQEKLPDGGTVVPLLIGIDKTVLTQHHGDLSAWPIYMTIGNLDSHTRRQQKRPALILIGFMPIMEGCERLVKAEVYHRILRMIFKRKIISHTFNSLYCTAAMALLMYLLLSKSIAIEQQSRDGLKIKCADGRYRHCFPIITGIIADYEEQVLLTGVKSGRHCTVCQVPPSERENLQIRWPKRTHEYTQQLIAWQRQNPSDISKEEKAMMVHDVGCFAWSHPYTNIHTAMMVDMLHQLLKGVIHYLIEWIKSHLSATITRKRKRDANGNIALQDTGGLDQLDHRFQSVPPYPGLKTFTNFNNVKQWTGVEQKAVARQLIAVVTPLLNASDKAMIMYARAAIDFWTLAQYSSHDDNTLKYMEHALYQMDMLKSAFRNYRINSRDKDESGHFNFPKFHAITHYPEFIRMFGTTDGVDTSQMEAAHKWIVKEHFSRTNKHADFQEQIIRHSTRQTNAMAMEELILHGQTKPVTAADDQLEAKVTRPSRPLNLVQYGWKAAKSGGSNDRITAGQLDQVIQIDGLLDALAVFVRECRNKEDGVVVPPHLMDRRERDASWVKSIGVQVHGSITCWKPDGKDSNDLQKLTEEFVRCSPNWQGKKLWRRDYVWMQEYTEEITRGSVLGGRRLGELQLIISVQDHERSRMIADDDGIPRKKSAVYTGALLDRLQVLNSGRPHEIHGMVEARRCPCRRTLSETCWSSSRKRNLGCRSFYLLESVIRSAHVIPTSAEHESFYVNNYIDWDQYNTLYDPNFLQNGKRLAKQLARQLDIEMRNEGT